MPEKKSTSANSKSVADNAPDGRNLGRASYRAEQARDAVIIFAFGWHPTPGYVDFFEQSPIDIFPPQFIFHTIPPSGMWPQVLAPFAIWVMFGASDPIKTVTVHDADGAHEIEVEQMPKSLAAASQATWVSGNVVRGGGVGGGIGGRASTIGIGEEEQPPEWTMLRMAGGGIGARASTMAGGLEEEKAPEWIVPRMAGGATTMATGEEGGGPTTMATGEENITGPTTMAVGEEGGGPTTMAVGEEDVRIATTFALGEEDPPITTLAIGEEGTTWRLGEEGPTTLALGEETTTTGLTATTLAIGEEDPTPTTLALGEEGPTTRAVGEENPTTLAVGEENPTTDAIGEEGGPTTMALGEETTAVMRTGPFGTF